MNANKIVRFAFVSSLPLYVLIVWLLSASGTPPPQDSSEMVSLLLPILSVAFLGTVLAEPVISRFLLAKHGGYTKEVMIVRLTLYQSGAIYGLLLSFMTYDVNYVLGFSIVTMVLTMLRAPAADHRVTQA